MSVHGKSSEAFRAARPGRNPDSGETAHWPEPLALHDRLAERLTQAGCGSGKAVLACLIAPARVIEWHRLAPDCEPLGRLAGEGGMPACALALTGARPELERLGTFLAAHGREARMGLAVFPETEPEPSGLLKAACRTARRMAPGTAGWARPVRPRPPLSAAELERAIAEHRLALHYQPQVSLADGRIVALEALGRLYSPRRAGLEDDPAGEERSAWVPWINAEAARSPQVIDWTLTRALADAAVWRRSGLAPVRVAVNLSLAAFEDSGLPRRLAALLRESGHPPELLELELTEDQPLVDLERLAERLGALRGLGLRLALDDVGSGFAGVSLLDRLPLDALKIDRRFVAGLPREPESRTAVGALAAGARGRGLTAIGEGVELAEQRDALALLGCDLYQGYVYSPPVSAEAVTRLLRD